MAEARPLTLVELRDIVPDSYELAKGTQVFDDKLLFHLARYDNKLFADAKGSSPSPYKVRITFEPKSVKGRCSCFAARTRPFCKHSAGLLVAWARAPEAFAQASTPPEEDGKKKREVKKGKVDDNDVMRRGVEQANTLVRELAVSGVASVADDRAEQVRSLATALREAKLRRISGRTLRLAGHLERAATRSDAFDASEYTDLVCDMVLTLKKLEKFLGGEPLAENHVEELIGKTWTKKDRKPVTGLSLVEVAFSSKTTPDEFVIRESRFVDIASGEHYSEKQILPGFLARRTVPKKSYAGRVLRDVSGTLFPTFSPRRLDIAGIGETVELDVTAVEELCERSLPDVAAVLSALSERRRDLFAPETMPVAMRVHAVFAEGSRSMLVDAGEDALFLPDDPDADEALARILRDTKLRAVVGDVALDGALPTLFPLAAVIEVGRALELVPLGGLDVATVLTSRKLRAEALAAARHVPASWIETAKTAGVGAPAIVLGEIREEMARAFAIGLASIVDRFAAPLVARLRDLSLDKPALLLEGLAARPDPATKLEDFVRVYQVLGLALSRLSAAIAVDPRELEPVPTYESVLVRRVDRIRPPRDVAAMRGAGRMNRYEAAVHYSRHYASLPPLRVAEEIYPIWADGSAAPYVARIVASDPESAVGAARRALGEVSAPGTQAAGRVAKLTAIRVCERVASPAARELLAKVARDREDRALAAHAQVALARVDGERVARHATDALTHRVLNGPTQESRIDAIDELADSGAVEAIPALRASLGGAVGKQVRDAAAQALARLGDVESVDTFLRMLRERGADPSRAKAGAAALGVLGDARGVDELLRALQEGFSTPTIAAALARTGAVALDPLIDLLEQDPTLADRKASRAPFASAPAAEVVAILDARIRQRAPSASDPFAAASLYLSLARERPEVARAVASVVLEVFPELVGSKQASARSLLKKCTELTSSEASQTSRAAGARRSRPS